MTKRSGENDDALVRRAASNKPSRLVKLADREDSLAEARDTGAFGHHYDAGLGLSKAEFGIPHRDNDVAGAPR